MPTRRFSPAAGALARSARAFRGLASWSLACWTLAFWTLAFWATAFPASAEDAAPDKSGYTLFNPTPEADLRALETDRPPKANSPYTVDAGHVQVETDIAVLSGGNFQGAPVRDWTVLDPTLKLGLTNSVDAEMQITPYQSAWSKIAGDVTTTSGVGDTYLRLKINLLGDDGGDIALAVLPYVKLPTARIGLGDGRVEGGLILPISVSTPGGFTVIMTPEVDELKNPGDNGRHPALDFLVNVSHPIDARWTFYSEIFTTQTLKIREKPVYTLDEALTFAVSKTVQLDFGGNFALNGAAPTLQIYTGVSQRF